MQLQALAAVVDEGSFDRAATVLHVTPSAVSQRIKALEVAAGRILVRRTKPVTVTEEGAVYLRLARQISTLVHETLGDSGIEVTTAMRLPIAVNGDSMSTWVLPALAPFANTIEFELHREDQDHTTALLRAGTVMAAVTAVAEPVPGCTVTRLGTMPYRPTASPAFIERWFPDGINARALSTAPVVVFDRKDELQNRYLRRRRVNVDAPPRHYVPVASDFARAVALGFGWGMLPDQQLPLLPESEQLVPIDDAVMMVTLYWQQWAMHTPVLDAVAEAIRSAAHEHLQ